MPPRISNLPGITRRASKLTLGLSVLLASLGTSITNVALPTLAEAFSAPFAQVQAVVLSYLAALTILVVIAGRLGDRYGLRPMMIAGLALFTAASLLCALAPGLWLLVAARGLQGAGAAFLMTLSMAMMRQVASEGRIGRAMGLLGTVSALGTALGPALGGLIIPLMGWRGIFWVQLPLSVLALILAAAVLSPDRAAKASPGSSLWLMLNRSLMPNLFMNVLVAAVMMTTLVVGPFYLSLALGLTATQVGLVMTVGPALSVVSGAPSGWLVDHAGSRRVLLAGLLLMTAGTFALATLPGRAGVTGYLLAIIVLTPGYQLFQAANNTAALADVRVDRRGSVSGLLNLSRNIGLIAGSTAMGALFAFGAGTADLTHAAGLAIAAGMQLTFLTAGGIMAMAILVAHCLVAPVRDLLQS